MRRILKYIVFHTSEGFAEWQIANPLCDVMQTKLNFANGRWEVCVLYRTYA